MRTEHGRRLYLVRALEVWHMRTTYQVVASSAAEAEALCRKGEIPYVDKDAIDDGPPEEQWLETNEVTDLGPAEGED
jgi:hypothetical protein